MIINLKLNGVEICLNSSQTISQDFEPLSGETILRMVDGTGVKQQSWANKTRIVSRGSGEIPLPLLGVDYSQLMILDCCSPQSAYSATTTVTLPPGFTLSAVNYNSFRSDVSMIGHAIVKGKLEHAAITNLTGNVVTLATVSGATGYQITYWPKFLVFASKPRESHGLRGGSKRAWEFVAEQQ